MSSRNTRINCARCRTSRKTLYHRDSLGYCFDANKTFLTFLFSNRNIGIQFLKDVGFIRSKVQCNSCGRDMTWYAESNVPRPMPRAFQLLISVTQRHLTTQVWRAVIHHRATSAMFSAPPLNFVEITLSRMTAAPTATFQQLFLIVL
jgi:ribosomal protein L18